MCVVVSVCVVCLCVFLCVRGGVCLYSVWIYLLDNVKVEKCLLHNIIIKADTIFV